MICQPICKYEKKNFYITTPTLNNLSASEDLELDRTLWTWTSKCVEIKIRNRKKTFLNNRCDLHCWHTIKKKKITITQLSSGS